MDVKTARLAQKLNVVLEQEASILAHLLDLVGSERSLLASFNMADMAALAKQKELLILQHSYLENERLDLATRLAEKLGLVTGKGVIRLLDLAERLGGALGEILLGLHKRLKELVELIQAAGVLNNRLMTFMLEAVQSSVAFLERHPATTTYAADGACHATLGKVSLVNSLG